MTFPLSQTKQMIVELVKQMPYFEQFSDVELRALVNQGHRQIVDPNQIICHEDDPGDAFYIVLSGAVQVISPRTGKYIATLNPGDIFGEIALLTGTPRTATVRAATATKLFVLDRDHLQMLLENHQDLAVYLAQKLSERQQTLINLGVITAADLTHPRENTFKLVRDRIYQLFGV
jgi:CRP-like cAMP-binding protein